MANETVRFWPLVLGFKTANDNVVTNSWVKINLQRHAKILQIKAVACAVVLTFLTLLIPPNAVWQQ